jgi:adenine/guanine phosphoribosyltransferase-like PRPP-binding protein
MTAAEAKQLIVDNLRGVPDFPKPGILFWDVTTLLLDAKVFQATIDAFVERYNDMKIDVVAGANVMFHALLCRLYSPCICSSGFRRW